MNELVFSIKLESPIQKLVPCIMDLESYPLMLPRQLKNIKILSETEEGIKTEETLMFKTLVKNEIKQTSIHKKISNNHINSKILSGPASGTNIDIELTELEGKTDVNVKVKLKLSVKALFLFPIIKKVYKNLLTGILLKIENSIQSKGENYV
ncbi:MAG: hypothetical protein O3C48_08515 [Crenarchaeota archaeon]|nr:hypothetical protein [Thermoproteota archaeon]MDC4231935.1 hypothetical protein [Nitrosopumilus sp.]